MSAEEIIREKHRIESEVSELQRSLRKWQQNFALLSNQEIELAAAKILDRTIENPVDRSMRLKLLTLCATLKRRPIGYKVSTFKRFWLLTEPQLLIEKFMAENMYVPVTLSDEALHILAQSE